MALEHGLHEVVVGDGLVDEAATRRVHRDQAGLGAVEHEMRVQPWLPSGRVVMGAGAHNPLLPCSSGAIRAPMPARC